MELAPIALFTYNRPLHTTRTVQELQKNSYAKASDLIVFSDGPKGDADREQVRAVRNYLRTVDGFKKVSIVERDCNKGLADSIISGVTEVVAKSGRVIVLEDDMVTSRHFLQYMNDGLEFYQNDERVISVHGYVYPVKGRLPETFFLAGADCWGWATWKRGWDLFESNGRKLLEELRIRALIKRFDFDGTYGYSRMLEDQAAGKNSSWAIRWYASAFLKDKLTLYPGRSLVHNIGVDASGVHCGTSTDFAADISASPVQVERITVEEDLHAREAFKDFYRTLQPSLFRRIVRKIRRGIPGRA